MINMAKNQFTVIQIFKLLHVLILWITSQRNISSVCWFVGLKQMCALVYVSPVCVCHCAFPMEKVHSEGFSIPTFPGRDSCVLAHACGEEVNPQIRERRMTFKPL